MTKRDQFVCIESADYQETRDLLSADPIIVAMAQQIYGDIAEYRRDDGSLDHNKLMLPALREYHRRGGTVPTHIGGPVEAIELLVGRWDAERETAQ